MTRELDSPGEVSDSTGDGVALASVWRRVLAFLVDLGLVGAGARLVAARLSRSRVGRTLAGGLLAAVCGAVYHLVLEGRWGRTVGKAVAGIAVVRTDGSASTYRAAAARTGMRIVDWLPAGYLLGLLSMVLTERRQRLGDLAADTMVVRPGRLPGVDGDATYKADDDVAYV